MKRIEFSHFAVLYFTVLPFLPACTNHYKHLQPITQSLQPTTPIIKKELTSIFYGQEKAQVFDAGIRFRDFYASGLLVVKAEEKERYRIVMTSKLGSKLFDFSLGKDHFEVIYCMEQLNRKIVLNILKKDLRLLTSSYLEPEQKVALVDTLEQSTVYRIKAPKAFRHFYYDNDSGHLTKIDSGSRRKARTVVDMRDYKNGSPQRIELKHLQIKLALSLKRLKTSGG